MQLPNTAWELIEHLDEVIPEPSPRPSEGIEAIMFNAGRRSVVTYLKQLKEGSVPKVLREKRGAGRNVSS